MFNAVIVEKLLTDISHKLSKYDKTIADWYIIKYATNTSNILFTHHIAVNLYKSEFEKLIKGFLLLSIFNKPGNSIISTHYRQYDDLIIGYYYKYDYNSYKKVVVDTINYNYREVANDDNSNKKNSNNS